MKPIKVYVSDDVAADLAIEYLQSHIPDEIRNSPEYGFIFPEIRSCIEDFSSKAKKLARTGTTIHIDKEFALSGLKIVIVLEYPRKAGFFERIVGIFRRE